MERLLHRDGVVRLLSIILALILWFNISGTQSVEEQKAFSVRLEPSPVAQDMQILGQSHQVVEVRVSGPRRDVAGIHPEGLRAVLDLQGFTESGQVAVPVTVLGLPASVNHTVSPAQVTVTLEKQVRKEFIPILINGERLTDNLKFQAALQNRAAVAVSGLQREVSKVVRVEARLDLTGVTETTERAANLVAVDAAGAEVANVNLNPRALTAVIRVFRLPPFKEVPVQPKFSGRVADGYTIRVSVDPTTVKVRGPQEKHGSWSEVATRPIDLTGQTQPFTVQAALIRPEGADSVDREYVTVTVDVVEQWVDRVFARVRLNLWHLAANLEAQPSVPEVTLRVSGPKLLLDKFNPDTLAVHVELENRGPGKHVLPVQYNKPQGLEVLALTPERVEVQITEKKP